MTFVGFVVFTAAAGLHYFAPYALTAAKPAVYEGKPDQPFVAKADRKPGTPAYVADESAQRKGTTVGAPTADQQARLAKAAAIDSARLKNADAEPGNWLGHGRTTDEQRFSPLKRIDRSNVATLGVAWEYETGTTRGLSATPIVADGIMFFTGNWGVVHAVEAKTGKLLWRYDPDVPGEWARNACCDVVNRGVAIYQGRVYVGSLDGRLIALDAKTGKPDWIADTLIDRTRPYVITGAPRVAKGLVFIGNGGAELGVRGYVSAYDARTGELMWRFFTVPGDPSKPQTEAAAGAKKPLADIALPTWPKDGPKWWEYGGGGTVWDSMVYDPQTDLLYVGVGNGSPWNREMRSGSRGDNLFVSSIVALKPDTGEYVWHFQTTPGDSWDYTATQHIMLADIDVKGAKRRVVMQAPKNGFFYVLDAKTGEYLSGKNYVAVNWTKGLDANGRPIPNPDVEYLNEPKGVFPAQVGGHNWQPMAFSPDTGLVYIPTIDAAALFVNQQPFAFRKGMWNTGLDFAGVTKALVQMVQAGQPPAPARGFIKAWDPKTQTERWSVPMAGAWNSGLLATAGGLVFGGGADGIFAAYDAATGAQLWSIDLKTGILAPPVTFEVDGEQYLAVLAGFGGAWGLANLKDPNSAVAKHGTNQGRMFVFKLGGRQEVAALGDPRAPAEPPPANDASPETIAAGFDEYHRTCVVCHGFFAESAGVIPDLRLSRPEIWEQYDAIVLEGALAAGGMASFADNLTKEDVRAIRAYVLSEAQALYDRNNAPPTEPPTEAPAAPGGESPPAGGQGAP